MGQQRGGLLALLSGAFQADPHLAASSKGSWSGAAIGGTAAPEVLRAITS